MSNLNSGKIGGGEGDLEIILGRRAYATGQGKENKLGKTNLKRGFATPKAGMQRLMVIRIGGPSGV